MPFVQRVINPVYISRTKRITTTTTTTTTASATNTILTTSTTTTTTTTSTTIPVLLTSTSLTTISASTASSSSTITSSTVIGTNPVETSIATPTVVSLQDFQFETVTNLTLSNALRQLASLVLIANDIFNELNNELHNVGEKAKVIKTRIDTLEKTVSEFDPKLVAVPESDLETFVQIKSHFKTKHTIETSLFTPSTRTDNLKALYDAAAKTPVSTIEEMDRIIGQNHLVHRSSDIFICTPVLGITRRKMKSNIDVEIETRMPAAVEELRKWTSTEAIGDITVTPNCVSRVGYNSSITNNNNTTLFSNITINSNDQPSTSTGIIVDSIDGVAMAGTTSLINQTNRINEVTNDMPLDHRLPSPEEQCQMIALKFPAVLIKVDTSGRSFQRICAARKSMHNVPLSIGEENNLNDEIQTIRRRSRSKKPRNRRRNTIAGTDQKEIEEAIKGDNDDTVTAASVTGGATSPAPGDRKTIPPVPPIRSKSSDILKKDLISYEPIKTSSRLSHFNTLKQWGRNRLRLINRSSNSDNNDNKKIEQNGKVSDIDEINVYETVISKNKRKFLEKERKLFTHERKFSYSSSSEKSLTHNVGGGVPLSTGKGIQSMSASIETTTTTKNVTPSTLSSSSSSTASVSPNKLHSQNTKLINKNQSASINPVKLRETSTIRKQRRSGLGQKDELHSSSGNWSASSESGRTSIGSEITTQPKSSASSTSLNHSNGGGTGCGGGTSSCASTTGTYSSCHPSSGPPSSIISRRRFLNTSASSSVTSDGTVTPDLQIQHDGYYDDETSSAYSCDTEGYYTSFHVDSGLKTLKEEEAPVTPLHISSALSSTNSFESSSNKTVLSAENEYELFGKGSTSTTASSAGTVCTTLMAAGSDKSLLHYNGPAVPERKSSLTKLHRSNSINSNGTCCTLERSLSTSTVGSTLERMGTIKRNGVLLKKEVSAIVHDNTNQKNQVQQQQQHYNNTRIESPDSGNNTSSSPIETNSNSSPTNGISQRSNSEYEYSESSDLEGVERAERIRIKTTINSSRIPSLCVITPLNSDDDDSNVFDKIEYNKFHERLAIPIPTSSSSSIDERTLSNSNPITIAIGKDLQKSQPSRTTQVQHFKKTTLLPLNSMFGKLRGVLPQLKKSPTATTASTTTKDTVNLDDTGEYVTIADVKHNVISKVINKKNGGPIGGIYYNNNNNNNNNDVLKKNLATVLSGNLTEETEYISLNELPSNLRCCESNLSMTSENKSSNVKQNDDDDDDIDDDDYSRDDVNDEGCKGKININATNINNKTKKFGKNENSNDNNLQTEQNQMEEGMNNKGARVTLDAQGKVIYNSDSLKRRKGAHTTFIPGPCVKDTNHQKLPLTLSTSISSITTSTTTSDSSKENNKIISGIISCAGVSNRKSSVIRPVKSQSLHKPVQHINRQSDKIIIKADDIDGSPPEIVRTPITTVIASVTSTSSSSSSSVPSLPSSSSIPPTKILTSNLPVSVTLSEMYNSGSVSDIGTINNGGIGAKNLIKGAYVNIQQGNQQQQQQYRYQQQQQQQQRQSPQKDYQHLYHDTSSVPSDYGIRTSTNYIASTLPRHYTNANNYQNIEEIHSATSQYSSSSLSPPSPAAQSPFHRNNNIYWTLQTRKSQQHHQQPKLLEQSISSLINNNYKTDQMHNSRPKTKKSIEELYSKPNKNNKSKRTDLKSTPLGFSTYFSPIPRNDNFTSESENSFKTSTPTKEPVSDSDKNPQTLLNDELHNKLFINEIIKTRSTGSSPCNSGRSTPSRGILEPSRSRHSWALENNALLQTCSDRLGTPRTSLMDFKKLLLSKAGKTVINSSKPSAVEQLKLKKVEPIKSSLAIGNNMPVTIGSIPVATTTFHQNNNSHLNILELSGSPKTFANRRMIRQGNFGSPNKISLISSSQSKHMSPRTAWKYQNYRTDVMSTAIPEVNSEEDTSSPNSSKERNSNRELDEEKQRTDQQKEMKQQEITEKVEPEVDVKLTKINENSTTVIENVNKLKNNIFLQAEENNFMKGEIPSKLISNRTQLFEARNQFLTGHSNTRDELQKHTFTGDGATTPVKSVTQITNSNQYSISHNVDWQPKSIEINNKNSNNNVDILVVDAISIARNNESPTLKNKLETAL